MDAIQTLIDGNIDFEGQRLAERLTTVVLILAGLTAWLLGFFMQDLKYTLYAGLGGTVLTILIVVPPWPMYNRHPVSWLPAGSRGEEAGEKKGQ
ncbi:microsomal signal peptidase 12 kDa subunit-domain-containing protein [Sphaerosporella brunnea]|uniref:Signal peptidase complex subunit 1 n=1 Tax=Sphaerosporella brunnea TaxID=1250544 RepID=A0A5J5F306_9PEZI|nr:microsomal signal peptidase 12 kDa subunit-domain-containing protein [Sphaerosporella brunnea]